MKNVKRMVLFLVHFLGLVVFMHPRQEVWFQFFCLLRSNSQRKGMKMTACLVEC